MKKLCIIALFAFLAFSVFSCDPTDDQPNYEKSIDKEEIKEDDI